MSNYFCGWYFRCQSDTQTLAIIPSIHKTGRKKYCSIQIITDSDAYGILLSDADLCGCDDGLIMGRNRFCLHEITLDLDSAELQVQGSLRFQNLTPLCYDIMGPFRFLPFLQCRHSVFSMRHRVNGEIIINGTAYVFRDAVGYTEGDRGSSFPRKYLWTQCSFPEGALMLSIAQIPFLGMRFMGIIGIVLLREKEYRLATYLGAKLVKISDNEIIVRQGKYRLILRPKAQGGHPLRAPVQGAMNRTIYEHPSCEIDYRLEKDGIAILEVFGKNAAFENEL